VCVIAPTHTSVEMPPKSFRNPSAQNFLTAMTTSALSGHPHLTKRGHLPRAIVLLVSTGRLADIATKSPESCDRHVRTLSELKSTYKISLTKPRFVPGNIEVKVGSVNPCIITALYILHFLQLQFYKTTFQAPTKTCKY
jgi:hypothetical protein